MSYSRKDGAQVRMGHACASFRQEYPQSNDGMFYLPIVQLHHLQTVHYQIMLQLHGIPST